MFICLSVCLSVCLTVNTITPEPLKISSRILRASAYGRKGGQVRKWPGPSRATAGPGKTLSRGPITPPILYVLRSRRQRRREGGIVGRSVPHHPTRSSGSILSSSSGVRGVARPKMDFMHISGQKEATWNIIFSIFERRRGPQTSRGPGKLPPPFPPLDGPENGYAVVRG